MLVTEYIKKELKIPQSERAMRVTKKLLNSVILHAYCNFSG